MELDRVLTRYGPDAADARTELHRSLAQAIDRMWPKDRSVFSHAPEVRLPYKVGRVYEKVEHLEPQTDAQRSLYARASQLTEAAAQTRLLMLEQAGEPIAWPFLATLVGWGTFLFPGFGLLSRANATVIVALFVGALSLASAAFLIIELSGPLYGVIQISPVPLRAALAQMQQ